MDEDFGGGDSAKSLSSLVTDDRVLILVVEGLDQDRDRVESEQLTEDEADLVPEHASDQRHVMIGDLLWLSLLQERALVLETSSERVDSSIGADVAE